MSKPENPPVCPPLYHIAPDGSVAPIIELRDYFAAQALAGMMTGEHWDYVSEGFIAEAAYDQADAMLTERSKGDT
jgi:hypothetical protein